MDSTAEFVAFHNAWRSFYDKITPYFRQERVFTDSTARSIG